MPAPPDVVVVGGGIVGLCIAHELRLRGVAVTLVERGTCGQGSTAKATGGIRTQFGNELGVRLTLRALEHFRSWQERYGGDVGYQPVGYLFLATSPIERDRLRRGVAMQNALGARNLFLGLPEIAERLPGVVLEGVLGGSFGRDDGLGDPGSAVASLVSACRRSGVAILEQTPMLSVETRGGRVDGIRTPEQRIPGDVVVLATGAWTAPIARRLGVELPIAPHHRQVYRAAQALDVPDPCPMTVDLGTGVYFHREGEGMVFGGGDRDSEPGWDDRFRPEEAPRIIELLTRRLPSMAEARLSGGWAGLREMTPDDLGVVGHLPGADGAYVAAGFSGHGFMHAPAIGEIVAAQICGDTMPFDISSLDPCRFEGELQAEAYAF